MKLVPYFWGYKRGAQLGTYGLKLGAPILAKFLFTLENCDMKDLARIGRIAQLDGKAEFVDLLDHESWKDHFLCFG